MTHFYTSPDWVDTTKPAGHTAQPYGLPGWWKKYAFACALRRTRDHGWTDWWMGVGGQWVGGCGRVGAGDGSRTVADGLTDRRMYRPMDGSTVEDVWPSSRCCASRYTNGMNLVAVRRLEFLKLGVAFLVSILVPYDLAAAKLSWAGGWVEARLAVNFLIAACTYGGLYAVLYIAAHAKRKFNPQNRGPSLVGMAHNIGYTVIGVLIFTAWEVSVVRLYATGAVPFVEASEWFTPSGAVRFDALALLIPL